MTEKQALGVIRKMKLAKKMDRVIYGLLITFGIFVVVLFASLLISIRHGSLIAWFMDNALTQILGWTIIFLPLVLGGWATLFKLKYSFHFGIVRRMSHGQCVAYFLWQHHPHKLLHIFYGDLDTGALEVLDTLDLVSSFDVCVSRTMQLKCYPESLTTDVDLRVEFEFHDLHRFLQEKCSLENFNGDVHAMVSNLGFEAEIEKILKRLDVWSHTEVINERIMARMLEQAMKDLPPLPGAEYFRVASFRVDFATSHECGFWHDNECGLVESVEDEEDEDDDDEEDD